MPSMRRVGHQDLRARRRGHVDPEDPGLRLARGEVAGLEKGRGPLALLDAEGGRAAVGASHVGGR
eukprot:3701919-Lingulodinium_polyedra.AAC.1